MNDTLKKELLNLLRSENRLDGELEDMTPIMREIYCWGLSNITNKEIKRIIKLYKKT